MFVLGTKAWAAIASAVILSSAVIAGVAMANGEDFDPVYAPEWKPGYRYSYDVTAEIDQVSDGLQEYGLPASASFSVGPISVKKEVLNTEDYRDDDGQRVYISAATFPLSNLQSGLPILEDLSSAPAFVTAERQSDLGPIPVVPDFSCRSDGCAGAGLDFVASNPLTYLNFPLTPDKRWTQEAHIPIPIPIEELQEVTRVHVVGEVTGMEAVDLPGLGKTDAVRVDLSYTPIGLQEVARDMVKQAEQAGFHVDRFDLQLGIHEVVHYSDEYQAVVQQQYIVHALVDIAIRGEFQGYEVDEDVYADFDAVITATMTGAVLDEVTAQQSPLEILDKLTNTDLIQDARQQWEGKGGSSYHISLEVPKDINVADEKPAQFWAHITGELPASHYLEYVVRDHNEFVVDDGQVADGFTVDFDDAGIYRVTVTAYDERGEKVTSASRQIAAGLETSIVANCSISALGSSCWEEYFNVQPGAQSLRVEAQHSGIPLYETLYLEGPDGRQIGMSPPRISLDAAQLEEMGYGEYALSYDNTGSHLGRTIYKIDLDYTVPREVHLHSNASGGDSTPDMLANMLRIVTEDLDLATGDVGVDLGRILD